MVSIEDTYICWQSGCCLMKRVAQRLTIVDHICWQCGCCDYSPVILLRYKKSSTNCSSFLLLIFWQSLSICYATGVSHEGVAYAGYKFLHLLKCWCLDRTLECNFGFSQVKQNIQGIVLEHSLSCWWEQQNQQNYVTGNYVVVSNQLMSMAGDSVNVSELSVKILQRLIKGAFMQFLTKYEWAPRLIKLSAKILQRVIKVLLRNSWQSMGGLLPRLSEPVTRRS